MSDGTNPQPQNPTPPLVQIGRVDGDMGMTGLWKNLGNASAMMVVCFITLGGGWFMMNYIFTTNREDRQYDRQMFREALERIQSEENRRAGEMKGSMDSMNGATRELTTEIRSWRRGVQQLPSKTKEGPP